MSDVLAGATGQSMEFPCSACGAKLSFHPGATQLKCEFCGFTEAIPASADEVSEHGFEDYVPDAGEKGYGTEMRRFACEQCGAKTDVEPHISSFNCAFCGSNQVVPQEQATTQHKPESLLPFVVDQKEVLQRFRSWLQGLWFRPGLLKQTASPDKVRGVYLPFWTYDTYTMSWWNAQAGHYYYEEDSEGNRKRKTRWEDVSGFHTQFFDDVLVQATPSVETNLVRSIEPFDTDKLVPYKPEFLSGYAAEDYRRDMPECWPDAKSRIDSDIRSECKRQIPGDTNRNLRVTTQYLNKTYKLCLLPIWIASYRYQGKPYRYLVNGQTGEVAGQAPLSWAKILSFILVIAAIIGTIVFFASR